MSFNRKVTGLLLLAVVSLPIAVRADIPTRTPQQEKTFGPLRCPRERRVRCRRFRLDAIPAVAPQVTYEDGLLTIVPQLDPWRHSAQRAQAYLS